MRPYEPMGLCPACGYKMDAGICPECGVYSDNPTRRKRRDAVLDRRLYVISIGLMIIVLLGILLSVSVGAYYLFNMPPRVNNE